jgi:hypothetical protein
VVVIDKLFMFKNQKGQTLIIIVFVMLIAFGIGVTLANRIQRSTTLFTDNTISIKSIAAAEALAENMLLLDDDTLSLYATGGTCTTDCNMQIDDVDVSAEVTYLNYNENEYLLNLDTGQVKELYLESGDDFELDICWQTDQTTQFPAIKATVVTELSNLTYQVEEYAYNSVNSPYLNGFDTSFTDNGFNNCFTLPSEPDRSIVRFYSYYEPVEITVIAPIGEVLPIQGFQINIEASLVDTTERLTIRKMRNFVPELFDYAIYSTSDTSPLIN